MSGLARRFPCESSEPGMADRRRTPLFTENFAANLEAIRQFLAPEGEAAFRRLLDRLFDDTVPTLCRFPQSGRPFLGHAVHSLEARALVRRMVGGRPGVGR